MVNMVCVTGSLTFTDTFSNAYSQQLFVVVGSGGGTASDASTRLPHHHRGQEVPML